ncbi:MAG: hypothetical protein HC771_02075 [Synechococcales cyanobacterium CRU_2_2]|nr:hypothetical protein [Synechococcales cyanobacterium CRU_2_2]
MHKKRPQTGDTLTFPGFPSGLIPKHLGHPRRGRIPRPIPRLIRDPSQDSSVAGGVGGEAGSLKPGLLDRREQVKTEIVV